MGKISKSIRLITPVLSSASGEFGQENRRTKDNVYICPGHVSRSVAHPPIREAIMPRSRPPLTGGAW